MSTRVLPGPRRSDDPRRSGAVGDGGELIGGQHRASGATGAGCGASRPSSTESLWTTAAPSSGTSSGARGPPSIHAGVPSGSTTSAGPPSVGTEADRLAGPPPDRLAVAAGVVAVGPHEEVQAVGPRLEAGGRAATAASSYASGVAEPRGVDRQLDHDRACACSRPRGVARRPPAGSASAASSTTTRSAADQAAGAAPPGPTITARPSATGPGAGIGVTLRTACDTRRAPCRRMGVRTPRRVTGCEGAAPGSASGPDFRSPAAATMRRRRYGAAWTSSPAHGPWARDRRRRPLRGPAPAGRGVRRRAGLRVPRPRRARPRAGHHPPWLATADGTAGRLRPAAHRTRGGHRIGRVVTDPAHRGARLARPAHRPRPHRRGSPRRARRAVAPRRTSTPVTASRRTDPSSSTTASPTPRCACADAS